jgi:carbonic anhydrase
MSHHGAMITRHAVLAVLTLAEMWGYGPDDGPERWADLDPGFGLASTGRRQSPVDIRTPVGPTAAPVSFAYGRGDLTLHREELFLSFTVSGDALVRSTDFERRLVGFHFHSPGEHTVDGRAAAIEMHLLHEGDDDRLTVVAVLIDGAGAPSFIGDLVSMAPNPGADGTIIPDVDLAALLPADPSGQWRYDGSRTFPPCTEDVDWVVLRDRRTVTPSQLGSLRSTYVGNVRPVQPLNGRTITSTP